MQDYVKATNQKLVLLRSRTKITDFHHATGNFVVQAFNNNRMSVADELSLALGTPCVVIALDDLARYAAIARKATSPPIEPGFNWTAGIAFWANGKPCIITLKPTPHATFFPIDKHTVGVFKRDQLTDRKEILYREAHVGGWSGISADIGKVVGGTWTARALDKIEGTLVKARNYDQKRAAQQSNLA